VPEVLKNIYYECGKNSGWDAAMPERPQRLGFASRQKIPHLFQLEPHHGRCAIVGAAPTIDNHLEELKNYKDDAQLKMIMSLNGSHGWLVRNGIIPNLHVFFEIDEEVPEEICKGPLTNETYYYACSHCSKRLFNRLKGYHRVLWHAHDDDPDYQGLIHKLFPGEFMVSGGFVTFFRSINIARILGFRQFDIYACDCSYETNSHFEGYLEKNVETEMIVAAGTKENHRIFKTSPSLSFLAHEFMRFCNVTTNIKIRVHGDGMLKHLHQMEYPDQYN